MYRVDATLYSPTETQRTSPLQNYDFLCSPMHADGATPPLFVTLNVHQRPLRALVDSGSTRTFLGPEAIELVTDLDLPIITTRANRVMLATGQLEEATDEVSLPIGLEGKTAEINARLLPNLAVPCILGLDFLKIFRITIDFANSRWHYLDNPFTEYRFESTEVPRINPVCCGITELTPDQSRRLKEFLASELPPIPSSPGITNLTEHRVDVGGHPAIKQRYYLVSPKVQEAIHAEVDSMLQAGIIEPSHSDWSSPIVMVRKPNGTYRFCLDFRKVNSVSKKDAYPLPYMSGILDKLRTAHYISTIDLSQAYLQVPLEKNSREITAFTVPGKGLFHFTRMPYGLTGAPATFQRLLDRLIGPEMEPHVFAYLDDIIIVTATFEEHLTWLRKVLKKILEANLTINPTKSEFCCTQVRYLGFLVNKDGLQVDPEKISPILEYPIPIPIKQLRRFLGVASWYRRFILEFATLTEPLTRLLKKNRPWVWTDEQQQAFERVRSYLTTTPTLTCPHFDLPFELETDASSVGIDAILTQTVEGEERVLAMLVDL